MSRQNSRRITQHKQPSRPKISQNFTLHESTSTTKGIPSKFCFRFSHKRDTKLWSTDTSRTRHVAVSDTRRCPTLLWHPYDTCRTGVLNNCFFLYFDTPTIGVRHLCNTHTSRVGQPRQISKTNFFLSLASAHHRYKSYMSFEKCWSIMDYRHYSWLYHF
jgi:hypothetical protein